MSYVIQTTNSDHSMVEGGWTEKPVYFNFSDVSDNNEKLNKTIDARIP